MKVYKCDICGKCEPRSIRNIIARNPAVNPKQPLNTAEYYGFNLFFGDFCEECLYKIERRINFIISDLKEEERKKHEVKEND